MEVALLKHGYEGDPRRCRRPQVVDRDENSGERILALRTWTIVEAEFSCEREHETCAANECFEEIQRELLLGNKDTAWRSRDVANQGRSYAARSG